MTSNFKYITYDTVNEMAYIYLTNPSTYKISSTEELPCNDDIMIDLGKDCPVIGVELEGAAATKVATLSTYSSYKKIVSADGAVHYSLTLTNQDVVKTVQYPGVSVISFLFADEDCKDFIGISVAESKWYTEEFFVNREGK